MARLRFRSLNRHSKTRLLAVGGIVFDDATLGGLVDRFISRREQFFGTGDILRSESLRERLSRIMEHVLAAQVEHVLLRRRADRFLCGTGDSHMSPIYTLSPASWQMVVR